MLTEIISLIVIVPTDLKDTMVDKLICLDCISGFNMDTIAGFSGEHSRYNVREQVQGYRRYLRFEVICDRGHLDELFLALGPVCDPVEARYWVAPVIEQGHFAAQ